MTDRVHYHPDLIFSRGTQVVTLVDIPGAAGLVMHPRGTVGVVVKSPADHEHSYRVRFADGLEVPLKRNEVTMLAHFKEGEIGDSGILAARIDLYERVIYRCVIGSQAYGLADAESDVDRRGIYVPSADLHWSLYGVPEQLENEATQEAYWELQKFLVLALKANPNILECLYTPLVEKATLLAEDLLGMKAIFLSRMVYQTYNGYVLSQFKKMRADIRNHERVKWKHVMHLIRLLLSGIGVLRDGLVPVKADAYRERLLAIRRGEVPWEEVENWRLSLHQEFNAAFEATKLPERPDYERANAFLISARRRALSEGLP
jgi:predicted nucleotidyltransferase